MLEPHIPVYMRSWNLTPEGLLKHPPPIVSVDRYNMMSQEKKMHYTAWKSRWDAEEGLRSRKKEK